MVAGITSASAARTCDGLATEAPARHALAEDVVDLATYRHAALWVAFAVIADFSLRSAGERNRSRRDQKDRFKVHGLVLVPKERRARASSMSAK